MKFTLVRVFAALVMIASLAVFAAPTPSSGTLSSTATTLTFSGGFIASDPSGASCGAPASPTCDEYTLTVQLPSDYATTNRAQKSECQCLTMILTTI